MCLLQLLGFRHLGLLLLVAGQPIEAAIQPFAAAGQGFGVLLQALARLGQQRVVHLQQLGEDGVIQRRMGGAPGAQFRVQRVAFLLQFGVALAAVLLLAVQARQAKLALVELLIDPGLGLPRSLDGRVQLMLPGAGAALLAKAGPQRLLAGEQKLFALSQPHAAACLFLLTMVLLQLFVAAALLALAKLLAQLGLRLQLLQPRGDAGVQLHKGLRRVFAPALQLLDGQQFGKGRQLLVELLAVAGQSIALAREPLSRLDTGLARGLPGLLQSFAALLQGEQLLLKLAGAGDLAFESRQLRFQPLRTLGFRLLKQSCVRGQGEQARRQGLQLCIDFALALLGLAQLCAERDMAIAQLLQALVLLL